MITLLTGENTFEIRSQRTRLLAEFREKHGADGVTIVDGSNVSRDELPQLLTGMSLFSPERLVVLDDASVQKDIWETIGELLPGVPETTDVTLVAPTADKRTKTYKWLQKNAAVNQAATLNEASLVQWLQTEARRKDLELSPQLARYIIEYTGGDQWQLRHDIDKLSLSGQPVTQELIRDVLIANPVSSAFDLLDAAIGGKKDQVNQLLDGVRSGEEPYRFFGLLSSQVFALLVVAAAGNRPADMVAKDSGLHPFVVRKTMPIARKLSTSERTRLAEITATTDMQLKSSGADPWVLITAALKSIANGK